MKAIKRIPEIWETYHSKAGDELTVVSYNTNKEYVVYYKFWMVFTTKLVTFTQKLPKEERK